MSNKLFRFRSLTPEDPHTVVPSWGIAFCHPPNIYHRLGVGRHAVEALEKCNERIHAEKDEQEPRGEKVAVDEAAMEVDKKPTSSDDEIEIVKVCMKENSNETKDEEEDHGPIFATCGGPVVRVYEACKNGSINLLQTYVDKDEKETYYTVQWTYNADGKGECWVVAGGLKGVLRVISTRQRKHLASLIGHGDAINDVKVHPRDPALVLTASKDESLRLWNLRTFATVAVFAGLKGHRGDVLYADFDLDGNRFASCGIDNSIRVWDMNNKKIQDSIAESHKAADLGNGDGFMYTDEHGEVRKFRIPIIQFPVYHSRKVHKHYVDCVKWLGNLLLSKSVHNRILLWKMDVDRRELASATAENTVLLDFETENCTVWFVRFQLDIRNRLMVVGNSHGVLYVFRLDDTSSKPICRLKPPTNKRHPSEGAIVRQCAFSADGSILAAVDDNGTVVRYDKRTEQGNSTA
eukprot:Plantae.Rhodophyta-Hildenbrandia_rubra.ctg11516.p1 GENE.Plantae.Rhodophyta-Hildenbrandia_rubra.ctg11516~~Plantae.Rhodophyta-Hildenbrandia_rubra.ctg11516.p1  ORF type:complete len:463 (-),score=53.86 Plantae.Rhodophyta-Hildenbrandia_rubra.ctg11516:558-1946(-)